MTAENRVANPHPFREQIAFNGTLSVSSASSFTPSVANVINNKIGLLSYGTNGSLLGAPFQGGYLCVKAPIVRTLAANSGRNPPPNDCSGSYGYDFNARIQSGADPDLVLGARVCTQFWYRDPQSASTTGLSNAVDFGIQP